MSLRDEIRRFARSAAQQGRESDSSIESFMLRNIKDLHVSSGVSFSRNCKTVLTCTCTCTFQVD